MSSVKHYTCMGVPVPQGSMIVVKGHIVHSQGAALKSWRRAIHSIVRQDDPTHLPVTLDMTFYLPRPVTVKRLLPSVRPDVDKLCRAVLDACTGALYVDDCQVVALSASKAYGEPRLEMLVTLHE